MQENENDPTKKSESGLMKELVEMGRGSGEGPEDVHAVEEIEYGNGE